MSDLVTRLRMQANVFSNLDFWSGQEPSQEETAIINDLREAVDRIANLELALVKLADKRLAAKRGQSRGAGVARAMGRPPRLGAPAMSDLASRSAAALRAPMCADQQVRNRRAEQAAVDLKATEETAPARRPRRADPTDDKINEAFKRATSR